MKLPLAYYGDKFLRQKCQPVKKVTPVIQRLIDDMLETMPAVNGMGLAANQVHVPLRIFVMQVPYQDENEEWQPGEVRVFINPEILSISEELMDVPDGCVSIPGLHATTIRPRQVTVRALDYEGNLFTYTAEDMEAACILHENDHLNGVLFIDRLPRTERKKLEEKLRKIKAEYYDKQVRIHPHPHPDLARRDF
jgi:peptide deformylase